MADPESFEGFMQALGVAIVILLLQAFINFIKYSLVK